MWLRLRSSPVVNTRVTWITMNSRNQTRTRKCSERAAWMLSTLLIRLNRVDNAGDIPMGGLQQPAADRLLRHGLRGRSARAHHRPAAGLGRPVQRQVLDRH